ncbi:MAG: corrinoid protein [Candidatus Bathyarchaeia archaeon]|nr:corrinoid protein [Candidatus Bathyarchaeota archaeon]
MTSKVEVLEKIRRNIGDLDFEGASESVKEALNMGINPAEIITDGISKGEEIVGQKFEKNEYFLSELIMAGEMTKQLLDILKPHIEKGGVKPKGRIVIGTVEGDIHDIGKNIVIMFLQSRGFDVVDLGVDVPVDKFIDAVREYEPQILAMSALMTLTAPVMGEVIKRLREVSLRSKVKVIIGGAPTTPEFGESIGADYQTTDPVKGVEKCLEWVKSGVDG